MKRAIIWMGPVATSNLSSAVATFDVPVLTPAAILEIETRGRGWVQP